MFSVYYSHDFVRKQMNMFLDETVIHLKIPLLKNSFVSLVIICDCAGLCCAVFSLVAESRSYSPAAVLLSAVTPLVEEHRPQGTWPR